MNDSAPYTVRTDKSVCPPLFIGTIAREDVSSALCRCTAGRVCLLPFFRKEIAALFDKIQRFSGRWMEEGESGR